jgi:hypothetical protein
VDRSADGKAYPEVAFEVSQERVKAFRRLFGGSAGVPPTLATAAEFAILPTIVDDPELDLDFTRVVHASQEYDYRRPLRVGETLMVRSRVASIREKGGHGFLTLETELVGDDGATAVVARSTLLERGADR